MLPVNCLVYAIHDAKYAGREEKPTIKFYTLSPNSVIFASWQGLSLKSELCIY